MILPLPTRSFNEWATEVIFVLGDTSVGIPPDEELWKTWALQLISVPPFDGSDTPDPEGFDSWRKWAHELILVNT